MKEANNKQNMLSDKEKLEMMIRKLDNNQKESLNKIRDAVEKIWRTDRIIPDFTDHGTDHSLRVIGYSYDILTSNENNNLTSMETYLLLASIYLHDIGMQFYPPEPYFSGILHDAESIAASENLSFKNINFESQSAMQLTDTEWKFIREYHSLLTAAMINYSFNNPYILHEALKDIQTEVIIDLKDICRYHSKYSIMDCDEKVTLGDGRKRLVATILRLADELDISNNRIKKDDYKILRRNSKNLVYWLKHRFTTVIISKNEIFLKIILHPEDAEKYGHIFQALIVNDFCSKNTELIEILNSYGYIIKIGDKIDRNNGIPQIVTNDAQERIPNDVLPEFKHFELENRYVSKCRYKYNINDFNKNLENELLNNKSTYKILILGDVILDSVMYMKEPPFDQVLIQDNLEWVFVLLRENEPDDLRYKKLNISSPDRCSLGGSAGIMTRLLQIPNVYVDMISIIGDDYQGNEIKELFKDLRNITQKNGIKYLKFYPIVIKGYPTITKYYYYCVMDHEPGGEPRVTKYRFDREDRKLIYSLIKKKEYQDTFNEVLSKIITPYDCIIIQDQGKGMINEYVIKWILKKYPETPIFIDPKYDFSYYKKLHTRAIIPNIKEAAMGIKKTAKITTDEDVQKRITKSKLFEGDYSSLKKCLPKCDSFIIKSDTNGAVIYSKDNDFINNYIYPFPIKQSEIKSNIGCGDTFDAYFVLCQLKGYSQETSVKIANIAAGIKRTKEIGGIVTPKEVCEILNSFSKECIKNY